MKKYTQPAAKAFAALTAACLCLTCIGVLLILLTSTHSTWILFCLGLGIPLGVLFGAVFLSSACSYLIIDEEKIVFPVTRVPKLRLRRNTVLWSDIKKISVTSRKEQRPHPFWTMLVGILFQDAVPSTHDTWFYTFHLKNGLTFTETFQTYGKKQEKEITDKLKAHTHLVPSQRSTP